MVAKIFSEAHSVRNTITVVPKLYRQGGSAPAAMEGMELSSGAVATFHGRAYSNYGC